MQKNLKFYEEQVFCIQIPKDYSINWFLYVWLFTLCHFSLYFHYRLSPDSLWIVATSLSIFLFYTDTLGLLSWLFWVEIPYKGFSVWKDRNPHTAFSVLQSMRSVTTASMKPSPSHFVIKNSEILLKITKILKRNIKIWIKLRKSKIIKEINFLIYFKINIWNLWFEFAL